MKDVMKLFGLYFTNAALQILMKRIQSKSLDNTQIAVNAILAILLNAIAINISSDKGAISFLNALIKSHDGSILNKVPLIFTKENINDQNQLGLLSNVLGNRINIVIKAISKMSKLDKNKVGILLLILAPIVIGILGKLRQQYNINRPKDLVKLVNNLVTETNDKIQPDDESGSVLSNILNLEVDQIIWNELMHYGVRFLLRNIFTQ
jgi:hypothetical protein